MAGIDQCTLFPEGDWGACCARHDAAYDLGGSILDFLAANLDLGSCVAALRHPVIAALMAIGTTAFGWIWWLRARRRRLSTTEPFPAAQAAFFMPGGIMRITTEQLLAIAGAGTRAEHESNMAAVVAGLDLLGPQVGLDKAHRLAHYIAQIAHESGRFRYDREIWDGKGAQAKYDTRVDLGNTPAKDGDGKLYRGRTGIQVTGRANYASFRDWCRAQGLDAPDFVLNPDLILIDPWEGLAPIWYWTTRGLNRYADENNIEMVTRRINGGMNGFDDRLSLYVRSALVLLGYDMKLGMVRAFQTASGLVADDIAGPATRAALHKALVAMDRPAGALAFVEPMNGNGTSIPDQNPIKSEPASPVVSGEILPPIVAAPRPDLIGRPSAVVERILRDEGSRQIQKANAVIKKAVVNRVATAGPAGFVLSIFAGLGNVPTWVWIAGGLALAATAVILFLSWRQADEAKAIKTARVDDAVTGNSAYGGPAKAAPPTATA